MGNHRSYRTESRADWGTVDDGPVATDQIKLGCMLRIADATELMSRNFVSMQNDLESTKRNRDFYREKYHQALASNAALRGVITKLKKKLRTDVAP